MNEPDRRYDLHDALIETERIKKLLRVIESIQTKLDIAIEALKYFANDENWEPELFFNEHKNSVGSIVVPADKGKKAREALEKIK